LNKLKIGIVSLGCDKNRIDSEIIVGNIIVQNEIVSDPKDADVIIVNTCGFIESAKQESINTILEMADFKNKDKCKCLVVTGCLSQRYGKELLELIPEIDIMLGVNDYGNLNKFIDNFVLNSEKTFSCNYSDNNINTGKRVLTTENATAYLRIAEGCNNFCTYCIIPKIRGSYRSRTMEDIIEEASQLASSGVKELIIVAQDTTQYGIDIYGEKKLPELLKRLSSLTDVKWIRLLYCYPEEITEELIYEIKTNDKILKYIDIPIQHISDNILKSMGRRGRKKAIIDVINLMRKNINGICIRTTFIVGFPNETEDDFNELKEFIKNTRFEKLGVFTYSPEEGTPASEMSNQIPEDIKKQREEELMLIQQNISKEINLNKIGNIYEVIVEGFHHNMWQGRNSEMSPEIDGVILFESEKQLSIGDFVLVKITKSKEYDLVGVVCDEFSK
jgi:ribosomal protein S12 methylthiotransferase